MPNCTGERCPYVLNNQDFKPDPATCIAAKKCYSRTPERFPVLPKTEVSFSNRDKLMTLPAKRLASILELSGCPSDIFGDGWPCLIGVWPTCADCWEAWLEAEYKGDDECAQEFIDNYIKPIYGNKEGN